MMNSVIGTLLGLMLAVGLVLLGYGLHDPIQGYIKVKQDHDRMVEITRQNMEVK